MQVSAEDLCRLLNEALNLAVRARRLDAIDRRDVQLSASCDPKGWIESGKFNDFVARHNEDCHPRQQIEPRSLTPQLWAAEAFDEDMHDWEQRARKAVQAWEGP